MYPLHLRHLMTVTSGPMAAKSTSGTGSSPRGFTKHPKGTCSCSIANEVFARILCVGRTDPQAAGLMWAGVPGTVSTSAAATLRTSGPSLGTELLFVNLPLAVEREMLRAWMWYGSLLLIGEAGPEVWMADRIGCAGAC